MTSGIELERQEKWNADRAVEALRDLKAIRQGS